ncbi:restriction endonuclease subunit S [Ruminococcus sp. XPD3002]|uniref:restriction endonuclease subunit S n=1 Tax=Ruminococcus sp. XPD3002 TaxID=1452269 RepID=UPI0009179C35|nr:type I restriction enzyme, S subunit [Ruminococcus flavefaciens]
MNWEKSKISDVCKIGDGAHASLKRQKEGIPYLTAKNITKNGIDYSTLDYISEETYTKHFKSNSNALTKPLENDILYSIIGSIGGVYKVKKETIGISSSVAIFRCNEKISPDYLYYFMKSDYFDAQIQSIRGGVAQGFMSLSKLAMIDISYPPLETQRRIASILSAYDDLIENNQKQIKLLEEAAQRLYKEWFVDLHFPGWEETKIVDGVPEGWERKKLIDIANVQYGYAFNGSLFNSEKKGMPIIRIRNIPSSSTNDYTTETADEQYLVYNGDIVVGMDGEFHINSWADDTAYLVQRTCKIKPIIPEMNGYLLWAIYEPIKYFEKTVVGATVAHLGKKHIDTISLLVPPQNLYIYLQSIFDKRQLLMNQNKLLKEARDRLLPKLMSGELEVLK